MSEAPQSGVGLGVLFASLASTALALIGVAAAAPAVAAQDVEPVGPEFDIERAWLTDETIFEPFLVTETVRLADALRQRQVQKKTSLLVMEHEAGRSALLTDQMAYHHVAQGDIAGEPWMVSF